MIPVPLCAQDQAKLPSYAYEGDAGADLFASCDIELKPFERALVPTGVSMAIPQGYAGFVLPRSGLAIKQGLSLVNSPGLIDSSYRGEVQVIAINLDRNESIPIHKGDRIAQLVIMKVEDAVFPVVDGLDDTKRGFGGFGSSGS
ncbi:MAG: dUTP diphosphatase [Eggerthellaceae bacterium]|nr:dUTP diphosphatase [Eggerthellaceae bacterium]